MWWTSRRRRSARCATTGCSRRSKPRASARRRRARARNRTSIRGGLSSCGVGSVAWSTAIAFDRQAFPKAQPSQIADLLDTEEFPGKRALPNGPRYTLELALLADGVDPANVYTELATPEGADRAFKALDKIKGDIFWWDNAQEPITWLLEKKVGMAAGYSGRIFRAAVGDRQRLGVIWDGQIYDLDLWAIPKGAKNKDGAMRFITFATDPARLATQAQLIAYGPMRKSALALVGKHPIIDVEMKDYLPTAPDNFKKALNSTMPGGARMARICKSASRSGAGRFRRVKASRRSKWPIRKTPSRAPAPPKPRPDDSRRCKIFRRNEGVRFADSARDRTRDAIHSPRALVLHAPHVKSATTSPRQKRKCG